jgi:hypothetical protein
MKTFLAVVAAVALTWVCVKYVELPRLFSVGEFKCVRI